MSFRSWLGKQAGASAFGCQFGKSVLENGIALGRTLYLGHGIGMEGSADYIFDDLDAMQSAGFVPYCTDSSERKPIEDESLISVQARILGLAFASQLAVTAASSCFKNSENKSSFFRNLGQSTKDALAGSDLNFDEITAYMSLPRPGINKALNLDLPGSNDLLGVFLRHLSITVSRKTVGFQRSGIFGFDILAVPLAEQTILGIQGAAAEFSF